MYNLIKKSRYEIKSYNFNYIREILILHIAKNGPRYDFGYDFK